MIISITLNIYHSMLQAIIVVRHGTILIKQAINVIKKAYTKLNRNGSNRGIELPK
jgi:hypothetical protein